MDLGSRVTVELAETPRALDERGLRRWLESQPLGSQHLVPLRSKERGKHFDSYHDHNQISAGQATGPEVATAESSDPRRKKAHTRQKQRQRKERKRSTVRRFPNSAFRFLLSPGVSGN